MSIKVGDTVKVHQARVDTHAVGSLRKVERVVGPKVFLEGCSHSWNINGTSLELIEENKMAEPLYKVGDKFEIVNSNSCGCNAPAGGYIEITSISDSGDWYYTGFTKDGKRTSTCSGCYGAREIEMGKIKKLTKKGNMKKLSAMQKKLLDADSQVLTKAEYINGDLELTKEGEKALMSLLFTTNKAELVKLAQADLDEADKEKK